MTTPRRPAWPAVGLAVLALGLLGARPIDTGDALPQPEAAKGIVGVAPGYQLPDFSATDLAGQPQSLGQYKGQVLVLHFWASWCPYCRGEIPKLTRLAEQFGSKGVRVLAISGDEDLELLKAFIADRRLPYPVVADMVSRTPVFDQYGMTWVGIPVTFILAKDGHTAFRLTGTSDIVGAVQTLLK